MAPHDLLGSTTVLSSLSFAWSLLSLPLRFPWPCADHCHPYCPSLSLVSAHHPPVSSKMPLLQEWPLGPHSLCVSSSELSQHKHRQSEVTSRDRLIDVRPIEP